MQHESGELLKSEDLGASLLEYALLAALIAAVCVAAIMFLGGEACKSFSAAGDGFNLSQ